MPIRLAILFPVITVGAAIRYIYCINYGNESLRTRHIINPFNRTAANAKINEMTMQSTPGLENYQNLYLSVILYGIYGKDERFQF